MTRLAATKAKSRFGTLLRSAGVNKKRIIVTKKGKAVAAMVPMEDVLLLQQLEDRADREAARLALAEMKQKGLKPIPYEQFRKELGLA